MAYLDYIGLAYFKSLLDENYLRTNYEGNTVIRGNVTFTKPVNASVKNDWLGQQIDKTYIKNLRPEDDGEVTLIYGDNHEKVITIDTAVTQIRSSSNEMYPVLLCYDANAEANQISKSVRYGHDVSINPAYGYLYAHSYIVKHPSYNRTAASSTRAEWMIDFRDGAFNPMSQIYSYLDPESQGGEHRMELRLYGNPLSRYVNTPNHNEATDAVSIGVGATRGEKLTFFGYCPSTPIYEEDGETLRKSLARGDQNGKDIITRDWLNLNGSFTGLVHTTMTETIDGLKTFKKTVTINSGDNNNKAGLYVQGDSEIHGNEHVYGTETVEGKLTAKGTAEIKGGPGNTPSLTVTGNEVVTGDSNIKGSLDVDTNANVDGTSNLHGKVTAGNGLEVIGNAKATTLTVTSGATVGTTLSVGGKTTLSGGLAVSNGTTTDTLTATSGATVSGGATVATGNLTVTNGGITANNGTGTFKTLSVTSGATVGTTLTANSASIGNGGLTVAGAANLNGGTTTTTLTASSNATVGGTLTVSGTTTATGKITANGGVQTTNLNATGDTTLKNLSVTSNTNVKKLTITSGGSIVNQDGNEYVTTIVNNSSTRNTVVSAILATNGGLQKDSNNQISVKTGDGIQISGGYVTTRLKSQGGIVYDGSTANSKSLKLDIVDGGGIKYHAATTKEPYSGLVVDFSGTSDIAQNIADQMKTDLLSSLGLQVPLNSNKSIYVNPLHENSSDIWHKLNDNNNETAAIDTFAGSTTRPFKTIGAAIAFATEGFSLGNKSINIYIQAYAPTTSYNAYNALSASQKEALGYKLESNHKITYYESLTLPSYNATSGMIRLYGLGNNTNSTSTYVQTWSKASNDTTYYKPIIDTRNTTYNTCLNITGKYTICGLHLKNNVNFRITDTTAKFPTTLSVNSGGIVHVYGTTIECKYLYGESNKNSATGNSVSYVEFRPVNANEGSIYFHVWDEGIPNEFHYDKGPNTYPNPDTSDTEHPTVSSKVNLTGIIIWENSLVDFPTSNINNAALQMIAEGRCTRFISCTGTGRATGGGLYEQSFKRWEGSSSNPSSYHLVTGVKFRVTNGGHLDSPSGGFPGNANGTVESTTYSVYTGDTDNYDWNSSSTTGTIS